MKYVSILLVILLGSAVLADAPTTQPAAKEIAKGITLAEGEQIAGHRAKLVRKDDEGRSWYELNVWDNSPADESIQQKYTVEVRDGTITAFEVDVRHLPKPARAAERDPTLNYYAVKGVNPRGQTTETMIGAKTPKEAAKKLEDRGFTKVVVVKQVSAAKK